jgi:hypothetical protein
MTVAEQQMYGMSVDDIQNQFDWMIRGMGHAMTAVSVLSDAQEVMARDPERARKFVNIAKFIMIEQMKQQQKAA